jgi:hypothetical protein
LLQYVSNIRRIVKAKPGEDQGRIGKFAQHSLTNPGVLPAVLLNHSRNIGFGYPLGGGQTTANCSQHSLGSIQGFLVAKHVIKYVDFRRNNGIYEVLLETVRNKNL